MKCLICGTEYKKLTNHIKTKHKLNIEEYFLLFSEKKFCLICGKPTNFISLEKGYCEYCSKTCQGKSEQVKSKRKGTLLKNYNVEFPLQSIQIQNKLRHTCLEKYGVDNVSKIDIIKKKKENTSLNNYGVNNPLKALVVREKINKTVFEKYGVTNINQLEFIKEKRKISYLNSIGVDNPLKSSSISKKISERNKLNCFYKLLEGTRLKNKYIPLFDETEYKGVTKSNYSWECKICGNVFVDHINNGHIPKCPICYPNLYGTSKFEKEVSDFCKQYFPNLIENTNTILEGKEIDIFIPEINLAIECDGIWWHSELKGIDSNYHIDKMLRCKEKDIQLIHIFENEWINKKEIVKSILLSKMGKITNKIYARKCEIQDISSQHQFVRDFLDENHLQGGCVRFSKSVGLFYNDELVSVVAYGKSRFNKNYDIELLRVCNKKNLLVVGGLSKLLKFISRNNNSIISYCDRRYSNGEGYKTAGFKLLRETAPNYFYFKGGEFDHFDVLYSRIHFQKHKLREQLEIFDPSLTEWENMKRNGWNRIWDCGNLVFEYSGQEK